MNTVSKQNDHKIDAGIIILTKNAGRGFEKLLERIYSQEYHGTFEVIVIDSGSTDDTLTICEKYPVKIIQIKPEEFHHGKTRNLGANLSDGDFLIYITQDALPCDNYWLQKLVDNFHNPQVAYVVGRQIAWEHSRPPEKVFYAYYFPDKKITVTIDDKDYYRDNMFISNVNAALRKDMWQRFPFSENIILAEDKEIAIKILKAGYSIVYEPDAPVYHAHDINLKAIFLRSIQAGIAIKQGISQLPKSNMPYISRAWDYFTFEVNYLRSTKKIIWLPFCIIYELIRFIGVQLGKTGLFYRTEYRSKQ